jgi:hypothetical protein
MSDWAGRGRHLPGLASCANRNATEVSSVAFLFARPAPGSALAVHGQRWTYWLAAGADAAP